MTATSVTPPSDLTREQRTEFQQAQRSYCTQKKVALIPLFLSPCIAFLLPCFLPSTLYMHVHFAVSGGLTFALGWSINSSAESDWKAKQAQMHFLSNLNRRFEPLDMELYKKDPLKAYNRYMSKKRTFVREQAKRLQRTEPCYQPPARRVAGWGLAGGVLLGVTLGATLPVVIGGLVGAGLTLWGARKTHLYAKSDFDEKVKAHASEKQVFAQDLQDYRTAVGSNKLIMNLLKRGKLPPEIILTP